MYKFIYLTNYPKYFLILLGETEYFWKKFKDLEELAQKVDWHKLDAEYLKEYKKIKLYYKKKGGGGGIHLL